MFLKLDLQTFVDRISEIWHAFKPIKVEIPRRFVVEKPIIGKRSCQCLKNYKKCLSQKLYNVYFDYLRNYFQNFKHLIKHWFTSRSGLTLSDIFCVQLGGQADRWVGKFWRDDQKFFYTVNNLRFYRIGDRNAESTNILLWINALGNSPKNLQNPDFLRLTK